MRECRGDRLTQEDQRYVLSAYVHRFTTDHKPAWASKPWKDGKAYPVQFSSDKEWLKHTLFRIRDDGRLDCRVKHCESTPQWPNNPELREGATK